ncbi:PREDICTED: THAP domain-containing protein 5 [Apaloderma vittatum]|uniref:THAP domain-containing protein 5 n=1 Tax=Apaloderma vittatum TaxID=57397 RepID=UPI000521CDF6|nr:PREDICTED: THAP domain-containing protein 5 [Apaloderma vittatum]KFP76401.1 THAP domain-containing protein 5 [Apaloderma vittatum]
MPRYCAASNCKNRGGQSSRDQRKLSFYPFPLHDKERLEKWLRNMKRDSWTPSKHQLLCSDHFTPDSLDVRWGIRYLKHTAVPTIFPSPDDKEKDSSRNTPQEVKRQGLEETNKNVESEKAFPSLELGTSKKNSVIAENIDEQAQVVCSTSLSQPLKIQKLQLQSGQEFQAESVILDNSSEQHIHRPNPVLLAATVQGVEATRVHAAVESPMGCTATVLQFTDPDYLSSSLKLKDALGSITDYAIENPNSHVVGCSVEVRSTSENTVLLNTVTQTIEQFSGSEESVIAIIVPAESPEEPEIVDSSFLPVKQEFPDTQKTETDKPVFMNAYGGSEVLQIEHSYCKQDVDRDHLWQKISKLNSKITLLEMQEIKTLGRLRSLEALIGQLKQENLLSEEKLKIVENCFTTLEVTMIQ